MTPLRYDRNREQIATPITIIRGGTSRGFFFEGQSVPKQGEGAGGNAIRAEAIDLIARFYAESIMHPAAAAIPGTVPNWKRQGREARLQAPKRHLLGDGEAGSEQRSERNPVHRTFVPADGQDHLRRDGPYQEQPPAGVAVDHPDCCRAVSLRFLPGAI